ncbi:MAG TPA: zinc-binding dehydrogenase, partial [Acidimicrobiia bacterium]
GLAERIVLPGSALISRPPGLDVAAAAVAVDAGATAYHAVACRAGVREGDSVLILGAGGLGSFAIELAKLFGAAPVIAADRDTDALERASKLGADQTMLVQPGQSLGSAIKSTTDGGVDVALEFVGRAATVDAAVKSLRPGGAAIVAGIGREPLTTIPPVLWASHEYALVGSFGSHRRDAERVLELLAEGAVHGPPIEIVSFKDARRRILGAASGKRTPAGRMVVVP